MLRVVIESPLNALTREAIERNKDYAKECVLDSLRRGEAPYASHLFFDQPRLLDDLHPTERETGLLAGFAWGEAAHLVAVYVDNGISSGMARGIVRACDSLQALVFRSIRPGSRNLSVEEVSLCLEATSPDIRSVISKSNWDIKARFPSVRHDGSKR